MSSLPHKYWRAFILQIKREFSRRPALKYILLFTSPIWLFFLFVLVLTIISTFQKQNTETPPTAAVVSYPVPVESTSTTDAMSVAQRMFAKEEEERIATGRTDVPPLTVEEVLKQNQACENQWGPHAVWTLPPMGGMPPCTCDQGWTWQNNDGTFGITFGKTALDLIDAPGKCVEVSGP